MHQLLKRLELIKTSIAIEDEEIIELQVMKIEKLQIDSDVKNILSLIENSDFRGALLEIEQYIAKYSGVVVYEDKEIQSLRLELKVLEQELQDLSNTKNEYLNDIHEFNIEYQLHLGEIIQNILELKEEILQATVQKKKDIFDNIKSEYEDIKTEYKNLKSKIKSLEDELENTDEFDDRYDELFEDLKELKDELDEKEYEVNEKRKETKEAKEEYEEDESTQEYEDVKKDHEEFKKEYEDVKKEERIKLNDEDKKELKQLYRKASKLCHPDIVTDELREQATEIFKKLNDAYAKKDLKSVMKILNSLENGIAFDVASDTITDKEVLLSKIEDIRESINKNKQDLSEIEEYETFTILQENEDLEEYFRNLKEILKTQYENLKKFKEEISQTKKEQIVPIDEDNYWDDEF